MSKRDDEIKIAAELSMLKRRDQRQSFVEGAKWADENFRLDRSNPHWSPAVLRTIDWHAKRVESLQSQLAEAREVIEIVKNDYETAFPDHFKHYSIWKECKAWLKLNKEGK